MTVRVFIEIAVGDGPGQIGLADADRLAGVAAASAVTGLRLLDSSWGVPAVDPSVAAAYLAGRHDGLTYLVDAPTTGNPPYNLARRIASFDRATGGRAGLVLRTGAGDEVSESVAAVPSGPVPGGPAGCAEAASDRWSEYADVLNGLWRSFPDGALLGNQTCGLFADESLISPLGHDGDRYRVAGPLDGPASAQGRPVLVSADWRRLGWARTVAAADAVIVDSADLPGADAAISAELDALGRSRGEVALLARIDGNDFDAIGAPAEVLGWAGGQGAAGLLLAGFGDVAVLTDLVRGLAAAASGAPEPTLRAALQVAEVRTDLERLEVLR